MCGGARTGAGPVAAYGAGRAEKSCMGPTATEGACDVGDRNATTLERVNFNIKSHADITVQNECRYSAGT